MREPGQKSAALGVLKGVLSQTFWFFCCFFYFAFFFLDREKEKVEEDSAAIEALMVEVSDSENEG